MSDELFPALHPPAGGHVAPDGGAAAGRCGGLPTAPHRGAAAGRLPHHPGAHLPSGSRARGDALRGDGAAGAAVRAGAGPGADDEHELRGLLADHAAVRARPRHRRGDAAGAGGDRGRGGLPAARPAEPADLHQGQPRRRPDPHARPDERHAAADPGAGPRRHPAGPEDRPALRRGHGEPVRRAEAGDPHPGEPGRPLGGGPEGSFDGRRQAHTIAADDQLLTSDAFRRLIVGYRNDAPIRLTDVAKVTDGAEDLRQAAWMNDVPAVIVNIQRQPGANIIDVVDRVKALLPQLEASLPEAVAVDVLTDSTTAIRAGIEGVQHELVLTVALVVLVIFLFLRDVTATVIPGVAVPLSLVGTLAVMLPLGYSLNNLTLMALTISTGFVVDDAIVMIENIVRHLEKGKPPLAAALDGAAEIGFTIVSLSVSLIAVLIPLLFMGDVVGRLFRELAVTLSATIVVSAVVSLTLTPMMCAVLLRHREPGRNGWAYRASERFFDGLLAVYAATLRFVLRHQVATMAVALATLVATVQLYAEVPKGFFPTQDTGVLLGISVAPPTVSFEGMARRQLALNRAVLADPAVESLSSFVGIDGVNTTVNSGRMLVKLKPPDERGIAADAVIRRIGERLATVEGVTLSLQPVQDLSVESRVSRTQYQCTLESPDADELAEWAPRFVERLRAQPELADVASDQQDGGLQLRLVIDRDSASRLGITPQMIDDALYDAYGQRQISILFTQLNQYRVVLEVEPAFRNSPQDLGSLAVRSGAAADGGQDVPGGGAAAVVGRGRVPLAAVTRVEERTAALAIHHEGRFPALILAAIVTVYLVLGVLYESVIHPLTILSTLPSAGVGALVALLWERLDLDVISLIGIILLIGIVKKNAIMMIDFAIDADRHGIDGRRVGAAEAIEQACLLRFRPIMMTTMAALLGAVPLALGEGVGSELRRPLGVTIIGGLLVSQFLTLYTTPVTYLWFDAAARWLRRIASGAGEAAGGGESP
ncbi:MAG: acriflavine resistance protein B [Planctomycetia bacterium]|nr:acriflavine resistance protein B [Planctomycetia bacterium]